MARKAFKKLNLRPWFTVSILFLHIFLLFLLMYYLNQSNCPIPTPPHQKLTNSSTGKNTTNSSHSNQCPLGRIFVYEMPPEFNRDIINNCDELLPKWDTKCDLLSNNGWGKSATDLSRLVPENLVSSWYCTDQHALGVIFHNRILNHKCRTADVESAAAFYIPFYAGYAVGKYLWSNSIEKRDSYCRMMLKWVQKQPYWNRSNGRDHFIAVGRNTWDFRRSGVKGWGSSCYLMPGMSNITRLSVLRDIWDDLDISVPYPTGFHPRSASEILQWQDYVRNHHRTALFSFVGGPRASIKNDFRSLLLNQCKNESDSCRLVNCARPHCVRNTSAVVETFLDSDFCLQPRGDTVVRRSIFDCMIAGSIPVFFWHETTSSQYEWYLPVNTTSYSVFIHRNEVRNGTSIKTVLQQYSKEKLGKMRETVINLIPKLIYANVGYHQDLGTMKDAFDVAIDGVLRRFKEHKQTGYKW